MSLTKYSNAEKKMNCFIESIYTLYDRIDFDDENVFVNVSEFSNSKNLI